MQIKSNLAELLEKIVAILTKIYLRKKEIVENREILDNGSDLFQLFYELGCQTIKENITTLKNMNDEELDPLVTEISKLIIKLKFC